MWHRVYRCSVGLLKYCQLLLCLDYDILALLPSKGNTRTPSTVLAFSKDGKFFASGCEDGILSIFNTKSGAEISCYEYDHESPAIDCIIWHHDSESRKVLLYAGTRKGRLYRYNEPQRKGLSNRVRDRVAQLEGPIRCMEFDSGTEHLIVGHGYEVSALRQITSTDWCYTFGFAYPAFPTPANFIRPMPHPTGIHIPRQNNRVLVTFLDHSVVCYSLERGDVLWSIPPGKENDRGRSAVSTDGMVIVTTNLFDGIDVYSLASNTLQCTANIQDDILDNVVIPICLINQDQAIFVGGSDGTASIVDLDTGKILLNDLVQAIVGIHQAQRGLGLTVVMSRLTQNWMVWVGMSPGSQKNNWFKKLHIKDVAFQALTWPLFILAASFIATIIWMVSLWLQFYLSRVPALWAWCSAAFISVVSSLTGVFSGAGSATSTFVHIETITHTPLPITAATMLVVPPAVTETVTIFNDRYVGEKRESSGEFERLAGVVDGAQEGEYEYIRDLSGL
ncbi:WD40-repeat-containing domain protein [Armillaria novae-zelandiae]|uniref:WD40-repeat-containing domain protein n=1 Tax=Armillaria novae-zelandiae TaxID=153914 RepID=A0AA39U105_9AGAR|nr:WD40-repeat-containing domain protein [Armillaria novae-zelandiae]